MARLLNSAVLLAMLVWALVQVRSMVRTRNYRLMAFTAALFIVGGVACFMNASRSSVMVLLALGTVAYIAIEAR